MPKILKKFTVFLVVVFCIFSVYGAKVFIGLFRDTVSVEFSAKVRGNNNAPIRVTEFIDFQCPACAKGAKYLKEMIHKHPKAIRLELKHYPLPMHRYGYLSSQYAECAAGQGKFWPFHDSLLARQDNWKRLADARQAFERIAKDIGLNGQELAACLEGDEVNKIIEKNKGEGKKIGVKSTPTYFVNGKMIVGKKSLILEIHKLLKEQGD